mgnify:FL=1
MHWIRQSATRLNQVIGWINQAQNRRQVTANYSINEFDQYLGVNGSYAITLANPTDGRRVTIKDESGNAAVGNITIIGTIDGATNATINTNYGVLRLIANGSNWYAI